jgi:hypothetical protein
MQKKENNITEKWRGERTGSNKRSCPFPDAVDAQPEHPHGAGDGNLHSAHHRSKAF